MLREMTPPHAVADKVEIRSARLPANKAGELPRLGTDVQVADEARQPALTEENAPCQAGRVCPVVVQMS
jgi:hypothetical protein